MNLTTLHKKLPLTIELKKDHLILIDQTKLPTTLKFIKLTKYQQAITAIKTMQVRGAQAIGATGAGGIFLASLAYRGQSGEDLIKFLQKVGKEIVAARPTAVNLAWAVNKMLEPLRAYRPHEFNTKKTKIKTLADLKREIFERYQNLLQSETNNNFKIGEFGSCLIKSGCRVLTHCNAGSLSAIWYGTATAPIFMALIQGKKIKVLIDETRPWLQGARLTAWEMDQAKIPYQINVDSAAAYLMSQGLVDLVIVGADHIAKNGDTANKIGTHTLALAAREYKIPFYVAAVSGTIDFKIKSGAEIKIEERPSAEILQDIKYKGRAISPKNARALNPVFDVTSAKYITGIITEQGIFKPGDLGKIR